MQMHGYIPLAPYIDPILLRAHAPLRLTPIGGSTEIDAGSCHEQLAFTDQIP